MQRFEVGHGVGEAFDGKAITDIARAKYLETVKHECNRRFGGWTIVETSGGWVNPDGRLVEEPGLTWIILSDDAKSVREFAEYVGKVFRQHSVVFIKPDNSVEFVESIWTKSAH